MSCCGRPEIRLNAYWKSVTGIQSLAKLSTARRTDSTYCARTISKVDALHVDRNLWGTVGAPEFWPECQPEEPVQFKQVGPGMPKQNKHQAPQIQIELHLQTSWTPGPLCLQSGSPPSNVLSNFHQQQVRMCSGWRCSGWSVAPK